MRTIGGRDYAQSADALRIPLGECKGDHSPIRPPQDRMKAPEFQMVEQPCERFRLIIGRNAGKPAAGLGSGRIAAAPQVVKAQNPITARIQGASRPHDLMPTAAARVGRVEQPPVAPDPSHGAYQWRLRRPRHPPCYAGTWKLPSVVKQPGDRDFQDPFQQRRIGRGCEVRFRHYGGGLARVIHGKVSDERYLKSILGRTVRDRKWRDIRSLDFRDF